MRFVSQYPGYGPQIRPQRQRALGDGGVEVLVPGLYVKFTPVSEGGMVYENERLAALNHFNFKVNNTEDKVAILILLHSLWNTFFKAIWQCCNNFSR